MNKYQVTLHYEGSITLDVTADNDEQALERARDMSASITKENFTEAIQPIETSNEVKQVPNKLYQPDGYSDDGTNIEYTGVPAGLNDNSYFASEQDCIEWLRDNNYDPSDFVIHEYPEDEIESPEIVEV